RVRQPAGADTAGRRALPERHGPAEAGLPRRLEDPRRRRAVRHAVLPQGVQARLDAGARLRPGAGRDDAAPHGLGRTVMASVDKVAMVTGAGTGVGRAVALALAQDGYAVVLAGRRQALLDETARAMEVPAARALVVPADVADPASVRQLFARTKDAF